MTIALSSKADQISSDHALKRIQKAFTKQCWIVEYTCLTLLCIVAVMIRFFPVIRYGWIIHEYDPQHNLRASKFLHSHGLHELLNWWDNRSWVPLGRATGSSLCSGLMICIHLLHRLGNIVTEFSVNDMCVFSPGFFTGLSILVMHIFVKEAAITEGNAKVGMGLMSTFFFATVPGYISRSTMGAFDYECVAVFQYLLLFWTFLRCIRIGTLLSGFVASLAAFFLVASWGGYILALNLIGAFMFGLVLLGKNTSAEHVGFTSFYVCSTIFSAIVPGVRIKYFFASEHSLLHAIFLFYHIILVMKYAQLFWNPVRSKTYQMGLKITGSLVCSGFITLIFINLGRRWRMFIFPFHKLYNSSLFSSVTEHQSMSWSAFALGLYVAALFVPAGVFFCFCRSENGLLFVGSSAVLLLYFACCASRILVLAPTACCAAAGIGLSFVIKRFKDNTLYPRITGGIMKKRVSSSLCISLLLVLFYICSLHTPFGSYVSSKFYSETKIVITGSYNNKNPLRMDDLREAMYWLRHNSKDDSIILSWWDYGYQIMTLGNRGVVVDNNTYYRSLIDIAALIFASDEDKAYRILRDLGATHIMVTYGGETGYNVDDINKFPWILNIASETSDVDPSLYRMAVDDNDGVFERSMMYKLSYYGLANKYDATRKVELPKKPVMLRHVNEDFSSAMKYIRIYKVKSEGSSGRGVGMKPREF